MTEEAGWVALGVRPELDRNFGSSLSRDLDPALSRTAKSSGHKFGALMGKAAVGAAAGVIGLGFAAFKIGQDAFAEARESQKVAALTRSTIKATGGAANVTAKQIDQLSNSIGKKSAIDDETVASGLNMLLTFKNVRNEVGKGNRIFDHAGQTITDMAAAMAASKGGDVDLKSASIQVGKALNDPVKGLTALSKVGVTFTDQQKEQVKALTAGGDTMGAQKLILRELRSEFGGAAASQATGADKVEFAWKNVEERLGTSLLPLMQDFTHFLLTDALPAIDGYVGVFEKKGVPALKHFFDKAKPVAEDVLPKLGDILGTVKDDLVIAAPYARDLVDAFAGMPDWAKKVIVGGGLAAGIGNKFNIGTALTGGKGAATGGLLGLVSKSKPLPVYVVNNSVGLPGTTPDGKPPSITSKAIKYAGPLAVDAAIVGGGAEALGQYLGSRPAGKDPAKEKAYEASLADWLNSGAKPSPIQVQSFDPMTGLPSINFNPESQKATKVRDKLAKPITPKFDILGMVEADAKVKDFRKRAERPIEVPVVAKIDKAIANLFGDAFGGDTGLRGLLGGDAINGTGPAAQRRGLPGVTVHGDLVVQAQDHKDFLRQAQQVGLGGRRP